MAAQLDNVGFTPTLGGTTDWVFSAAISGYQSPALAGATTAFVYELFAKDTSGNWEISRGALTISAGPVYTFARTTVLYNSLGTGTAAGQSGAGTKINFAAAPSVYAVLIKESLIEVDEANNFSTTQKLQARQNIAAVLSGHLFGLTLSTAGGSSTFNVATGEAADHGGLDLMQLGAGTTAKTTAAWAVGSGNGALDTGVISASAWYWVFLIKRPDTGVVDLLITKAVAATVPVPSLPTNYTLYRYIGSMVTDGSSHWYKFVQFVDKFLYDVDINNLSGATGTTAIQTLTISSPLGVQVDAIIDVITTFPAGSSSRAFIFSPDVNSPGTLANSVITLNTGQISAGTVVDNGNAREMTVRTNTSSQIKYAMETTTGTIYITTTGWIDTRGRFG